MTPYERVSNRLAGNPVDRIPNLNIIMTFAAKHIGIPYKKYVTDYRYLVEGNIKCCEEFGIDMVSAISDPFREAHAFGANVIFPDDEVPICKDYFIKEYSDIKKLRVKGPSCCERMLDRIKAIELYKKEVGGKYPVLGWVEGAFAEANDLRGMNEIMVDLYEEPEFVEELLEICTEQAILFAIEQIKVGADFIGIGDAAASLVGPVTYSRFVLPYEQKLIHEIHDAGAKVKLHICGNITSILEQIPSSGADMIDVDWMVDFSEAVKAFSGKCSACGNFDPVEILLRGDEISVIDAVNLCIDKGDDTTFIAAGCEVPKDTPLINLMAVNKALESRDLK